MNKTIILFLGLTLFVNAQLRLTIDTDKDVYEYGETIRIYYTLHNDDDTAVTFFASNYNSCQAEFFLNDYHSSDWEACLPTVEEIIFPPHSQRIYSWTIVPYVYGLPDKDGEQVLIGYYRPGWNTFSTDHLKDTTTFYAPVFLGGQLNVTFNIDDETQVDSIKNYFEATVLESSELKGNVDERWQISGTHIDTVKNALAQSSLFSYIDYNRGIIYDSILVTSIDEDKELQKSFTLYQNYPNPFNPSTTIQFTIPFVETTRRVVSTKLVVYDILGQKIKTLLNKKLSPGSYEVEFDGSNLPSGVYFYRLTNENYSSTKKMLLLR